MVGMTGFEPATLCSQSRCASQAALHPDLINDLKAILLETNGHLDNTQRMENSSFPSSPNKEKYLKIKQAQGLSAAITALHLDIEAMEQECFNQPGGFLDEIWQAIETYRNFSRELWELNIYEKEMTESEPKVYG
jgi:hypothetical protein